MKIYALLSVIAVALVSLLGHRWWSWRNEWVELGTPPIVYPLVEYKWVLPGHDPLVARYRTSETEPGLLNDNAWPYGRGTMYVRRKDVRKW